MIRKFATAAALAAAIVAVPGIASADTNVSSANAHTCFTHPDLDWCQEPADSNTQGLVDGSQTVGRFSWWTDVREGIASALVSIWDGPQW